MLTLPLAPHRVKNLNTQVRTDAARPTGRRYNHSRKTHHAKGSPVFRVHFENLRRQPGVGSVYRRVTGRPPWVWGTAVALGILPFALLLVLVVMAALFTTAVIFFALSAVDQALQLIAGGGAERDIHPSESGEGRRNVRVVGPEQR